MSGPRFSIIPAWIVTDSRLKGRDLQVLCVLGRHVDRNGWCTRSQVKLAGELSCARSTVQASLDRLKKIGVLQMRANETNDGRDCAHDYRILFDVEIVPEDLDGTQDVDDTPCRYTGTPADISASPADSGSAPYKNVPLKNEERERASADDGKADQPPDVDQPMADDRKALKALKLAHPQWPTFAADSVAQTERAFLDNAPADRAVGLEHWQAYVRHVTKELGRAKICAFSTYWRDRKWLQLPAEALEPEGGEPKRPDDYAPPFGPAWSAWRIAALLAGPDNPEAPEFQPSKRFQRVWMFQAPAADRRGQRVGERWHGLKDAMEPVDVDSELFALWKAEHDLRGWPWLPDIGAMRAVWFPKGGPAGLDRFIEAVRSHAAQSSDEGKAA